MAPKSPPWIHILKAIQESGTLAAMSSPALKVYVSIKIETDFTEGIALPSIRKLMKNTGLAKQTVSDAIEELVSLGLLESEKTKGRTTSHSIIERVPIDGGKEAKFRYISAAFARCCQDIKAYIETSKLPTGSNVTIETVNIGSVNIQNNFHIHIHTGDQSDTVTIDDGDIKAAVEMMEEKMSFVEIAEELHRRKLNKDSES